MTHGITLHIPDFRSINKSFASVIATRAPLGELFSIVTVSSAIIS